MRPLDFTLLFLIGLCIYGALDPDGAALLARARLQIMRATFQ